MYMYTYGYTWRQRADPLVCLQSYAPSQIWQPQRKHNIDTFYGSGYYGQRSSGMGPYFLGPVVLDSMAWAFMPHGWCIVSARHLRFKGNFVNTPCATQLPHISGQLLRWTHHTKKKSEMKSAWMYKANHTYVRKQISTQMHLPQTLPLLRV